MNALETALKLIAKNRSVIPINTKTKKPYIAWKEFQTRIATADEVKQWFKDYPEAGIALVTGEISNIVVFDVDPRNGGTNKQFIPFKTVSSKTGGKGRHYFFNYPSTIKVDCHPSIMPGIDLKAESGYVIIPPSLHPSGNKYEWIKSILDHEPNYLPQELLDLIRKTGQKRSNFDSNLLHGVDEGSRNGSAASVAGKLLKRFKKGEWETEVWPLLSAWNAKNIPPLSEYELRNVFISIAKLEAQKSDTRTETPLGSSKRELLDTNVIYAEVEDKVKILLPNSQTVLRLVLAVAVSSQYKNPLMIWLLLVGVPSSGKTDLVRLIRDAEATYYLDNLTQNAFISGERPSKSNKVHDLLPLLDKRCLVIKDWTSIFSLDEKMTKKLLGDLVGIYDKEFTKFSSRRGNVSYKSAFSQLGCITPATLNKHTNYMNMVGPRFLAYTMPPSSVADADTSYELIFSEKNRSEIEKEARKYTSSYLNQLSKEKFIIKPLNKGTQDYLRVAAELMSNSRGIVILQSASFKNEAGDDVKYYEILDVQVEEPWRAIQQLISLAQYLTFVVGKDTVGVEELTTIKEVVISSMPADRSQALRSIKNHGGILTAKELADISEKSARTSRRLLDELFALKVLDKNKGSGPVASDYRISARFRDFLLLDTAEFMSNYTSSRTGTPQGIEQSSERGEQKSAINRIPGLERYES